MTRYLSNLTLTLAAVFLVVAEFAFTLGTAAWLTFAGRALAHSGA